MKHENDYHCDGTFWFPNGSQMFPKSSQTRIVCITWQESATGVYCEHSLTLGFTMSEQYMTTKEAQIMLRIPAMTFKQWERDGVMDGVKHPAFKIGRGWKRLYKREDVEQVAKELPDKDYHPQATVKASEWTSAAIRQYGRMNLLANAKIAPVRLSGRSSAIIISVADDVTGEAAPARMIGRHGVEELAKLDRIASHDWFPGIEFKIEVV